MSNPRLGGGYDPGRNYPNGQLTDVGSRLEARDIAGYTLTPAGARGALLGAVIAGLWFVVAEASGATAAQTRFHVDDFQRQHRKEINEIVQDSIKNDQEFFNKSRSAECSIISEYCLYLNHKLIYQSLDISDVEEFEWDISKTNPGKPLRDIKLIVARMRYLLAMDTIPKLLVDTGLIENCKKPGVKP